MCVEQARSRYCQAARAIAGTGHTARRADAFEHRTESPQCGYYVFRKGSAKAEVEEVSRSVLETS
jgi:hypothetical protein